MEKLKEILTKKVLIFSVLLALLLCLITYLVQVVAFPYFSDSNGAHANLAVTPVDLSSLTATQAESAMPTPTVEWLPGVVSLGMTVQVKGTGQDGLRMRAAPGTDSDVLFLAEEGESFTIVDGPVIQDSLIWWKIQSLQDVGKLGWSVQDYLASVKP
ncbi:MAG: hypothetical protein PWQ55_483 [Chloroflexota bacterium]|nr:hypothetical protein [Chloroflexota bacterium]